MPLEAILSFYFLKMHELSPGIVPISQMQKLRFSKTKEA